MAVVQRFDSSMVENWLKGTGWTYSRVDDNHYSLVLNEQQRCGCDVTCRFYTEGDLNDIYVVRVIAHDKDIPRSDWGRAIYLCNTWMNEKYWPRAFLYAENYDTDTVGRVLLEDNHDLGQGIHQELLNQITERALYGGIGFWEWAHQEKGW